LSLHRDRRSGLFPCPCGVPARPSPDAFASGSVFQTALLSRVPSPKRPSRTFEREISAWVLVPPRDITGGVHSPRRLPSLRYVPSSGVLNLSTAYSTTQLCRPISSRSRVQGIPVQGILSPHSGLPHRKLIPAPLPLAHLALGNRSCRPCLACLDFEALIRVEQRDLESSYSPPTRFAPLIRFLLLQVISTPPFQLPGNVHS